MTEASGMKRPVSETGFETIVNFFRENGSDNPDFQINDRDLLKKISFQEGFSEHLFQKPGD